MITSALTFAAEIVKDLNEAERILQDKKSPSFIKDVAALFKLRLTFLVIISAVLGYFMGHKPTDVQDLLALCIGGLLLTGGSNGLNQVWEREWDKLMHRTRIRPIPTGRMSPQTATWISLFSGAIGVFILWFFLNTASGILGLSAIVMYVLLYTPLKRVSSIAVLVGAFPGAIPPMLGYVANTNDFGLEAGLLFAMQFVWQFPHFWAIAWVSEEDYKRAGYKLLPFDEGQTPRTAFQILLYSLFLIPVSLLPWALPLDKPMIGNIAAVGAILMGGVMPFYAIRLYRTCDMVFARKVMFASFFYLPIVQLLYVIDCCY
ncbi:MAG: heme o synthase [Flavobacteriales bacterium]